MYRSIYLSRVKLLKHKVVAVKPKILLVRVLECLRNKIIPVLLYSRPVSTKMMRGLIQFMMYLVESKNRRYLVLYILQPDEMHHEEVLSLQPMIPPTKRFDIFSSSLGDAQKV